MSALEPFSVAESQQALAFKETRMGISKDRMATTRWLDFKQLDSRSLVRNRASNLLSHAFLGLTFGFTKIPRSDNHQPLWVNR